MVAVIVLAIPALSGLILYALLGLEDSLNK